MGMDLYNVQWIGPTKETFNNVMLYKFYILYTHVHWAKPLMKNNRV